MKKVVIVGGGIAGMTLAYRLESAPFEVTLVESRPRLGGVIETFRKDGFVIEGGPDSFITMKPWGKQLCVELGLEDRLVPTRTRKFYIHTGGRLHVFPPGMLMMAPTKIWPVATTPVLSFSGKLRMTLDLFLPLGRERDESIASFFGRRLGREALEKIAEPLMAGIYMAPAHRLSIRTTFPRFLDMERKHRSLIRAMRGIKPSGAKSAFLSLRGGMDELVRTIRSRLKKTRVVTGSPVERVEPGFRVRHRRGSLDADILVLATPGPVSAGLVRLFAPDLADAVDRIPVSGSATVSLGFRAADVGRPIDGTGFVIPRRERKRVLACTWSSMKFEDRAPDDHRLVRCFFGGADDRPAMDASDTDMIRMALDELTGILQLRGDPVVTKVFRWPEANPIYEVGHQDRIREIDRLRPENLHLIGSAYRGVGIPDGIREATDVAARILR